MIRFIFLGSVGRIFLWINVFFIYFHLIYNRSAFGCDKKKFDKCLFTGWSGTVFILLANIFYYTFKFLRNNIVWEPIIDERLFYVFCSKKIIHQFECPLWDCISENNNIYVGLTSTTLTRKLTMHLSDISSIAQQQNYGKILVHNNIRTPK